MSEPQAKTESVPVTVQGEAYAVTVLCTPFLYPKHVITFVATCGQSELKETVPIASGANVDVIHNVNVQRLAREVAHHEHKRELLLAKVPQQQDYTLQIGNLLVMVTCAVDSKLKNHHAVIYRATCGQSQGHTRLTIGPHAQTVPAHIDLWHTQRLQTLSEDVAKRESGRLAMMAKYAGAQ